MLSVPIVLGLAAFGGYLNSNGKRSRAEKHIRQESELPPEERPLGTDVYNADRVNEVDLTVRKAADTAFRDSLDPCNTNIIPAFYNTLYEKECGPFGQNNIQRVSAQTVLPQSDGRVDPNSLDHKILNGPMWKNPVPEEFSNLPPSNEQLSTLTGLPLDDRHNNMVPFFGGSVKQNMNFDVHEQKLEAFTGVGDIIQRNKEEVGPFFELRRENTFGTPNMPDELRNERFFQSNLKTNILPAPQIRVPMVKADKIRPRFRTVDELRVESNPQVTYEGRIQGPAQGTAQRGIQAPVKKNNPPKYHWTGQERFIGGRSVALAMKARENFTNLKCQNREDSDEQFFGPALASGGGKAMKPTICRPDYTISQLRSTRPTTDFSELRNQGRVTAQRLANQGEVPRVF